MKYVDRLRQFCRLSKELSTLYGTRRCRQTLVSINPIWLAGTGTSRSMKPAAWPEIGRKPTVKTRERGGVGSDLKGCAGKSEDGSPHDGQLCGVDVGPVGPVRAEGPVAHEAPVVVVLAAGGHEFLARVGVTHADVPQVDVGVRRMTSPRLFSRDLAAPG